MPRTKSLDRDLSAFESNCMELSGFILFLSEKRMDG